MTIDIDKLEALANAAEIGPAGHRIAFLTVLELCAEIRRLRSELSEVQLTLCKFPSGSSWHADGANRDAALEAFCHGATSVELFYGRRHVTVSMADFDEEIEKAKP
jgi:hypothetical protein